MIKRAIVKEAVYPHPPAKVWRALTDSRLLAQWLMPNDFEPTIGHRFTFHTPPRPGFDGIVRCQVLEVDEPRRLAYTWRGGPIDTVVTLTLEPSGQGTRLRLEHTGFAGLRAMLVKAILAGGWGKMIRTGLPLLLSGIDSDTDDQV